MSWYSEIVEPGIKIAGAISGSFIGLSFLADQIARSEVKEKLVHALRGSWTDATTAFWQELMAVIFGRKKLGLKAFAVSFLFSILFCSVITFQYAWSNADCAEAYKEPSLWIGFLIVVFAVNGIGDFCSIAKTRYLVQHFVANREISSVHAVILFVIDLILGIIIFILYFSFLTEILFYSLHFNFQRAIASLRPSNILEGAYVVLVELKNYGLYLSGTNRFTTGAYLYSSLAATLWSAALFVPLAFLGVAQSGHIVSRRFREFWNINQLPFGYVGISVGVPLFVVLLTGLVASTSVLSLVGAGPGVEAGCRCRNSCSMAVP